MTMARFLAILVGLILGPCLVGQNCVTQALGSLDKARAELAAGEVEKARPWIEQAALECATSAVVLKKIADLYEFMGENANARSFRQRAEAQARGPQLTLERPDKPAADRSVDTQPACAQMLKSGKGWVREKYAIVVGISKFKNSGNNLQYAAKDANDFATVLKNPAYGRFKADPDHVKVLLDENATATAIRGAINEVARNARAEDLVVMYFSSHGMAASSDVANDDAKSGYIVTHESEKDNLYGTAFPMEELRRVVEKRIRACRVVLFLDTCFSGDTISPAAAGGKFLSVGIADSAKERIAQGIGRVVIASSRNDEQSWESEKAQNSFFTHFLLDALRANGGKSDITSIFTHLQRTVPAAVRREKMGAKQTPVMWPEGQRIDVVIGTAVE